MATRYRSNKSLLGTLFHKYVMYNTPFVILHNDSFHIHERNTTTFYRKKEMCTALIVTV